MKCYAPHELRRYFRVSCPDTLPRPNINISNQSNFGTHCNGEYGVWLFVLLFYGFWWLRGREGYGAFTSTEPLSSG